MQRLFSMFPPGWPGFGLLLLRCSVAIGLLIEVFADRQGLSGWTSGAAMLLSMALLAGYLTPIAAVSGLLFHGLIGLRLGVHNVAVEIAVSLDLIALACVGPGAYSVDAFRLGRRVVVLPPA